MSNAKSVAFFLGSGCSYSSGQPKVKDITDDCLQGRYFLVDAIDPYGCFVGGLGDSRPLWGKRSHLIKYLADKAPRDLSPWRQPAASVQTLLSHLFTLDLWRSPPNYEDVAGALRIVAGALAQERNDPFVEAFLRKSELVARLCDLEFPEGHRYFEYSIVKQIGVIEDYLGWVIAHNLKASPRLSGYDSLAAAITLLRSLIAPFHFVTTNYDCNLERLFQSLAIKYDDGFPMEHGRDDRNRKWRFGNRFRFFQDDKPAIVKLHGSMNWYTCASTDGQRHRLLAASRIGLSPVEGYYSSFYDDEAGEFSPLGSPEMLRGSLSKAAEYSYDIYSQLLMAFERVLENVSVCVVAGFGWADEAIVARLFRFMRTPGKILLVFDGSAGGSAIGRSFGFDPRMVRKGSNGQSLLLVERHLSDLSPPEAVAFLKDALSLAT